MGDHKQPEHHYERIADVEEKITEDLKGLVTECKSKVSLCEESSNSLQNALTELQMQRDNAKGLINETFQSYKAILEKKRVSFIKQLSFTSLSNFIPETSLKFVYRGHGDTVFLFRTLRKIFHEAHHLQFFDFLSTWACLICK